QSRLSPRGHSGLLRCACNDDVEIAWAYRSPSTCAVASAPHAPHHLLDMGDRSFRQNAVAEVEDQPALRVVRQHIVDRAIERRAAGDQRQRIEIALDGDARLHALADEGRLGSPVDADSIDAGCLDIDWKLRRGATGEADDLRVRDFRANACDDAARWL